MDMGCGVERSIGMLMVGCSVGENVWIAVGYPRMKVSIKSFSREFIYEKKKWRHPPMISENPLPNPPR